MTKAAAVPDPGQVIFSVASQVALFALAGTAAWLTVRGDLSPAESVALIVVAVRYLEPFTILAELGGSGDHPPDAEPDRFWFSTRKPMDHKRFGSQGRSPTALGSCSRMSPSATATIGRSWRI